MQWLEHPTMMGKGKPALGAVLVGTSDNRGLWGG